MLNVKVISDVHLELAEEYPAFITRQIDAASCDVVCLCGDIGNPSSPDGRYERFLEECAKGCRLHVLLVMGNHEAYGRSVEEAAALIGELCTRINARLGAEKVVFLNNTAFDVPVGSGGRRAVRFLGTTLWSDVDPAHADEVRSCISDFRCIRNWDLNAHARAFRTSLEWLRDAIAKARAAARGDENSNRIRNVVVMTHHVPLTRLGHPRHAGSSLQSAFASDLQEFILANTDIVSHWFYGHDHYSTTATAGRTLLASNQLGYDGEMECRYNNDLIIRIAQNEGSFMRLMRLLGRR